MIGKIFGTIILKCQKTFAKTENINIFYAIFAFGVCLRLVRAFYVVDLDQDEALNYNDVVYNTFANLFKRDNYIDHDHPPLSFVMHKIWLMFFHSEYSLRVPSFLFSIISILIIIIISKKLFSKDRSLMLSFPLYFCASSFFVLFGVLFRTYSMGILLSLFMLNIYIDIYRGEQLNKKITASNYWLLGATAGVALFTEYSAIWPIIAIVIFSILKKHVKKLSFLAILAGVAMNIPWFLFSFLSNFTKILDSKKSMLSLNSAYDYLNVAASFFDLKFLVRINNNFLLLMVIAIPLSICGILRYSKKNQDLSKFLLISLIVPNLISIAFSLTISPVFDFKNLWFSNLILLIGLLMFINELRSQTYRKLGYAIFISVQLLTIDLSTIKNCYYVPVVFHTAQVKKAFEYIKKIEVGKAATLYILNVDWHSVPAVYKNLYYPDESIEIKRIGTIDFSKDNSARQHQRVYFFDVGDRSSYDDLKKIEFEFKCKFQDIKDIVSGGVFKKCVY